MQFMFFQVRLFENTEESSCLCSFILFLLVGIIILIIFSAERDSNIQLMDAEVALYWKIMCKHLQAEAQVTTRLFYLVMQHFYATFGRS